MSIGAIKVSINVKEFVLFITALIVIIMSIPIMIFGLCALPPKSPKERALVSLLTGYELPKEARVVVYVPYILLIYPIAVAINFLRKSSPSRVLGIILLAFSLLVLALYSLAIFIL